MCEMPLSSDSPLQNLGFAVRQCQTSKLWEGAVIALTQLDGQEAGASPVLVKLDIYSQRAEIFSDFSERL